MLPKPATDDNRVFLRLAGAGEFPIPAAARTTILENLRSNREWADRWRLLPANRSLTDLDLICSVGDEVVSGGRARRSAELATNAFIWPRSFGCGCAALRYCVRRCQTSVSPSFFCHEFFCLSCFCQRRFCQRRFCQQCFCQGCFCQTFFCRPYFCSLIFLPSLVGPKHGFPQIHGESMAARGQPGRNKTEADEHRGGVRRLAPEFKLRLVTSQLTCSICCCFFCCWPICGSRSDSPRPFSGRTAL